MNVNCFHGQNEAVFWTIFQGTGTKGSLFLGEDSLMTTTSRRRTSSRIKPTCSSRSLPYPDTGKVSVDLVLVLMPHDE